MNQTPVNLNHRFDSNPVQEPSVFNPNPLEPISLSDHRHFQTATTLLQPREKVIKSIQ